MSRKHRALNLNNVPPANSGYTVRQNSQVAQPQAGMSVTPVPRPPHPAQPGPPQAKFPAQASVPAANPSAYDGLIQRMILAIEPLLSAHQTANAARLDRLESGFASLTTQVSAGQQDAEARAKRLVEHVTRSSTAQKRFSHDLATQFNDLKSIIGTSALATNKKTLWSCLDQITFSVEEALERAQDLDAPAPEPTLRHEMGTNTMEPVPIIPPVTPSARAFVSVGVETEVSRTTGRFTPGPSSQVEPSRTAHRILFPVAPSSILKPIFHTAIRSQGTPSSSSSGWSPADWSRNAPPPLLIPRNPVAPRVSDQVAGGNVADRPSVSGVPKRSSDAPANSILGDPQMNNQSGLSRSSLFPPDKPTNLTSPVLGGAGDLLRSPSPESPMLPPVDGGTPSRSSSPLSPLHTDVASPIYTSFPPIAHISPSASPTTPKQTFPSPTISRRPARTTPTPLGNFSNISSPHPSGTGSPDMRITPSPRRTTKSTATGAQSRSIPPKSQSPKASQAPKVSVPAAGSSTSPISILSSPSPAPVNRDHSPMSPTIITSDSDSEPVKIVSKKQARPSVGATPSAKRVPVFKLTVAKDKQKSAAATRVKRRKSKASEVEMEPPLKKARMRMSNESSVSAGPSTKAEKGARKSDATTPTCDWPKQAGKGADGFGQNFLQCDMCSLWYHYGCVGILVGDPRLKPAEIFICPPCESGSGSKRPRRTTRGHYPTCGRPDCAQDECGNTCVVAGIIGRKGAPRGASGKYHWLVKWDGYPISRATWQDEESMGDSQTLIEEFRRKAKEERVSWSHDGDFLLEEAMDGGWSL